MPISSSQSFKGRKLVIATMHEKERVVGPILEKALGVEIIVPKNFNTDKFGTFTREIARAGDMLQAARAKVNAALDMSGCDLGVSSEGSFDAHPSIPFTQSNLELVLFVDRKNGYEIRGHHRAHKTNIGGQYVATIEEALGFAQRLGFPGHGVVVRKSENGRSGIHKNIQTEEAFVEAVNKMLSSPFAKRIFVESDMRAHRNPTRMKAIEKAAKDLIKNIASLCPQCQAPGFVVVDFEKGLLCSLCDIPTDLPLYDIYRCALCKHSDKKRVTKYGNAADPQHCGYCNP